MKVITGRVRANYINIFTPVKLEETQEARYSISLLIPKTDIVTLESIQNAIYKCKLQLFEKHNISENIKSPLRDGDIEKPDNEAYKGHYFINATSKYKPGIVDRYLNDITNPDEIYPGCYIRTSLNFYTYSKQNACGVACSINNVQKISDGEIILINSRPEDDFSVIENEDMVV